MSMRDPWAGVKSKSAPRHNGKRKEKKDEYLTLFDMRTEKEVVENVLAVAGKDESVRAVIRTDLLPGRKYQYYKSS